MRIMFVTGSLVHGGAEHHSITLMNRLAERGHECHAAYVKDDPSQLERIRLGTGGSVLCLEAGRFFDRAAIARFGSHLAAVRPSVLVAANGYALMYASLARRLSGLAAPLAVTFHTTRLYGLKERIKMTLDRPFFWSADRVVFVCHAQREYWARRLVGRRRSEVIYNGIDTEHFADRWPPAARVGLRRELGFAADDYVIGIAAVLRPEKNHVQLVDAVARLRARGLPARALLIGDGPTRERVEAHARGLGIADHVVVTGLRQEVRPLIAACDVMALCSLAVETFSLAALEAMAMARPVVHADLGGAREMVTPGYNGFVFPAGDTEALVRRLGVLAEPIVARAMGRNARQVVETRFSERAMLDRYETMLLDLSAATGARRDASARHVPA